MDFLAQVYRNNWSLNEQVLAGVPSIPQWDICVLTAANERQARAYEMQLEERRRKNLLPTATQWIVVPDPEGTRIGSGGATLNVFLQILHLLDPASDPGPDPVARATQILRGKRVLIVHSGGDSKRLPQYSAFGKLFARVPHELPDGRVSTLFDEFIVALSGLPLHMYEGIVIASGDVLLIFDHMQLDFNRQGVVGVAMSVPASVGTRHGVFVPARDGNVVRRFLHKPDVALMEREGALDAARMVNVDTGMVWLDPEVTGALIGLAGPVDDWIPHPEGNLNKIISEGISVNLYGDFLAALPPDADLREYLLDESDGVASKNLQEIRQQIWGQLRGHSYSMQTLRPARFIHFGSTVEYREFLLESRPGFVDSGWSARVQSFPSDPGNELALLASYIENDKMWALGGGVVEDSSLRGEVELGRGSILSGVRHTSNEKLTLGEDLVLHQLPLRADEATGWISRLYGIHDNPKKGLNDPDATFLNRPLRDWMRLAGVTPQMLWGDLPLEEQTLWNAMLYPISIDPTSSWRLVRWMQNPQEVNQEEIHAWRFSKRSSLGESYLWADLERMLSASRTLEDEIRISRFLHTLKQDEPADHAFGLLGRGEDLIRRVEVLTRSIRADDRPLFRMRAFKATADVLATINDRRTRIHADRIEGEAFSEMASYIRKHTPDIISLSKNGNSNRSVKVLVEAPARIDFGGGWSDTPPYSIERGGTVLNAAISLDGGLPIHVKAAVKREPDFLLESIDLGVRRTVGGEDLLVYRDLSDPLAMHKAALVLCGFHEQGTGMGIKLSTEIAIPKGSGLGTSSIMAAAILRALNALNGYSISSEELFNQVLCLEQMLTTGGGWQDQVGGMVGGIKLIVTEPGIPQVPRWHTVSVPEGLHERLALVYTGQRRLAKRILRTIMGRYISRDPGVVSILREIQDLARSMEQALRDDDLDHLGELMSEHWRVNKRLDPGSTNAFIDHLFEKMSPYSSGGKLAGAGGGGFAIVITKDRDAAGALRSMLESDYAESGVRIWPCRVVDTGITVCEIT